MEWMNNADNLRTIDKGRELMGEPYLCFQTQEECAELIVALSHFRRLRSGADSEVREEIADVLIMAFRLRRIFGEDQIDAIAQSKLDRIARRLEDIESRA